jgi:hypothetical protein
MIHRTLRRYTRKQWLVLAGVAAGALLCAVAVGQQVKKTKTAEIRAETMLYHWDTGTFEFVSNCHLVIKGAYNADMTAPKMTAKLSKKGDKVESLTAQGPVHFEVLTQPDASKVCHKIVASSQGSATYTENTQTVVMNDGAVADVASVKEDGTAIKDAESAHFEGDRITADLAKNTINVDKAHLKVTTEPEQQ